MRLYYKILLMLFLVITAVSLTAAGNSDEIIISKVKELYVLDNSYTIEILSNQLNSTDFSADDISIRSLTQKEPLGLFTVLATIIKDEKVDATGQVKMRIKKYADVMVLTDRVAKNDIISSGTAEIQRMDITDLREKAIMSLGETEGLRLKRNLRKGTILTAGDFETIPDIESGMETKIVYDDGFCKITALGVALQTGVAGEYVKVKNKSTKKIILARIVDDKSVAIDP